MPFDVLTLFGIMEVFQLRIVKLVRTRIVEWLDVDTGLLGHNPKGWGPSGLGCPSVCLSVCPSYFSCTG